MFYTLGGHMDGMREDDTDPYQEALSDHERRSGHSPKDDRVYCEMCVVLFNFMVEEGQICREHPDSYFEPKTKTKNQYCEQCQAEEVL